MSYIAHSLELDCGILIEVCSNPSNQFGTHHSEKELHIPQLPSFLSCFPAPASPWIYSVFINLPVPDLFYNCMNNMWSSGNAFLFSVHVSFKTQPHSHLSATDTHEGTVWMFHKDLHSMRLLYAFVPSLDSMHHTLVHSVFLRMSHTSSHLPVLSCCIPNSCI